MSITCRYQETAINKQAFPYEDEVEDETHGQDQ
jgi:hypothetical protein